MKLRELLDTMVPTQYFEVRYKFFGNDEILCGYIREYLSGDFDVMECLDMEVLVTITERKNVEETMIYIIVR